MKKVLLVLFGLLAAVALLIVGVFMLTSGVTGVANDFFAHIKAEKSDDAWSLLSQEFQKSTDRDELLEFLESKGLSEVVETTWNSRSITNGSAEIHGSVDTASGSSVPLKIYFVKENDEWCIQHIGMDSVGVAKAPTGTALTAPPEAEQLALVRESLTVFGESVNGKDFSPFADHISETWKKGGVTVEQLNQAFAAFIDHEINILPVLDSLAPAFDNEVVVADNGVMSITGVYPSTPSKIKFQLDYIKEGTSWKVVRTAVNVE